MYEDFFKNLPQDFDKESLEERYYAKLSTAIDDAMYNIENGNVSASAAYVGKAKELAEALYTLRNVISREKGVDKK